MTMGTSAGLPEPNRGGRPRHSELDGQILSAALTLLGEAGVVGVSPYAVARRVGVARGSVALRWPDRESLVTAALATTAYGSDAHAEVPFPQSVVELVSWWCRTLHEPRIRQVLLRLMAERESYPTIWQAYQSDVAGPAMLQIDEVISTAQRQGQARADVDPSVLRHVVIGAIWMHDEVPDQAFQDDLVTVLLRALAV